MSDAEEWAEQVEAFEKEVARLKAERDRLRAALEAAGDAMMYFDVGRRTEAYLATRKALERRP